MNASLSSLINGISEPDECTARLARERQSRLAKPPGSLGRLEDLSIRLAAIAGRMDTRTDRRRILVFAADNGIVAQGVATAPQSVTLAQAVNISRGITGAAVLARHFHAEIEVIDVGISAHVGRAGVLDRKVAFGTRDFSREAAMTREQTLQALWAGVEAARRAAKDGIEILGIGEMGIGNTSTSAAVLSALTGAPVEETAGRGGGLSDEALKHKRRVIEAALRDRSPDPADPVGVLSRVGGFDLCAMAGAFLGAASMRLPVVIDGFISAVAALCAARLAPLAAAYMIPSHCSAERGFSIAMEELGLEPMLALEMRLGEGSGCPMAFELCSAALRVLNEMATFEEASIDDSYLDALRVSEENGGPA